jgi:hypothetical protein
MRSNSIKPVKSNWFHEFNQSQKFCWLSHSMRPCPLVPRQSTHSPHPPISPFLFAQILNSQPHCLARISKLSPLLKTERSWERDGVKEESNNSHRLRFRHIVLAFSLQISWKGMSCDFLFCFRLLMSTTAVEIIDLYVHV